MPKIRIQLYQVEQPEGTKLLTEILQQLSTTPINNRLRELWNTEVRMEQVAAPNSRDNPTPFWLMDFTKLRFEHGPGRVSRADAIQGFDLEHDEGFGEEAAALYDVQSGYIVIQYNHYGVRPKRMAGYLSIFDEESPGAVDFVPKVDNTAQAKMANNPIIKSLTFKIAPSTMTSAQREQGVGLVRALELNDHLGAETIEVTLSAGRARNAHLNMARARAIVSAMSRMVAQTREDERADIVSKLEVRARTDPDAQAEVLDLIAPTVEIELDGLVMGSDHRFTVRSRWDCLIRARRGWNGVCV